MKSKEIIRRESIQVDFAGDLLLICKTKRYRFGWNFLIMNARGLNA